MDGTGLDGSLVPCAQTGPPLHAVMPEIMSHSSVDVRIVTPSTVVNAIRRNKFRQTHHRRRLCAFHWEDREIAGPGGLRQRS